MGIKRTFYTGEFYHVYSRGIDKRITFDSYSDILRFLDSMYYFNQIEPIESIHSYSFNKRHTQKTNPLVEIIDYNILDNHFHILLKSLQVDGISKFMNRLIAGYVRYYNEKNDRSGQLFTKPFKSKHITTDQYLEYIQAYIRFNHLVHGLRAGGSKSSIQEIKHGISLNNQVICSVHNDNLKNNFKAYEKYALDLLSETIKERRENKNKRKKSLLADILIE